MKACYTILAILCMATLAHAQQLPLYTQYRDYQTVINPAAVTSNYLVYEYNHDLGVSYRRQWTNIPNGIDNQMLRYDWIAGKQKLILGGYLLRDRTGPTSNIGGALKMGYIISYDPRKSGLAFGLNVGMNQFAIRADEITFYDQGDFAAVSVRKLYPDVGAGAFFYTTVGSGQGDKIYIGASVPQMFGLDLNFRDPNGHEFRMTRVQHFYGMLGMIKYFNEDSFIEPSVWFKYTPNAPINIDLNARLQLSQILYLGGGYNLSKSLHLEVGALLGDAVGLDNKIFRLGYGFERNFSNIGPRFGSTHEINLVYGFSSIVARR